MKPDGADELLKQAQADHAAGRIGEAIEKARRAVGLDPGSIPALIYLGTTLITRRLAFEEGLDLLERALSLAPDDPGVNYTLGWCYEFVAYRLEKTAGKPY